tara:strand:- start:82 stop:213 length:132 start_codon:yes stop_codon:yes gene_type:complete
MKVKDLLEQLKEMDPEAEVRVEPVQSYVMRPVVKDDVEKGSEE